VETPPAPSWGKAHSEGALERVHRANAPPLRQHLRDVAPVGYVVLLGEQVGDREAAKAGQVVGKHLWQRRRTAWKPGQEVAGRKANHQQQITVRGGLVVAL
jgi:hypothetical protein